MFAQQRKNRRNRGRSISEHYLTRSQRKAVEWYEERRQKAQCLEELHKVQEKDDIFLSKS